MKKIIIVLILVISSLSFKPITNLGCDNNVGIIEIETSYEEGWKDGYCEGWKDVKGQNSLCPLTPLCPLPKLDCSEGYKCGYNRGFKAGIKAAKK